MSMGGAVNCDHCGPHVCGHGGLHRECEICERDEQLQAADALAKAAGALNIFGHEECGDREPKCAHKEIGKALAAYEKIRGLK